MLVHAPSVVTEKVPEPQTLVPASGPVKKVSRFSGSDHSTPAGTSSHRYFMAKPVPPTYSWVVRPSMTSSVILPEGSSTRRIRRV